MTCSDCIHWTADAWRDDQGAHTYGSKLVDGESVIKGRCDQMPKESDDRWTDEPACFLFEPRERQQDLFGG